MTCAARSKGKRFTVVQQPQKFNGAEQPLASSLITSSSLSAIRPSSGGVDVILPHQIAAMDLNCDS